MKNQKIELNAFIWSGWNLKCPIGALGEFFENYPLAESKQSIKNLVLYANKEESYGGHRPNLVMNFYFALSTLCRSCFAILYNKKWQDDIAVKLTPVQALQLGTLSEVEYQNPLLVIQEVFDFKKIKDWERALLDLTYAAILDRSSGWELIDHADICYLYQILDAAWLIEQRTYPMLLQKLKKDYKSEQCDSVQDALPAPTKNIDTIEKEEQIDLDPFETAGWSLSAYQTADLVLKDIFSNDGPEYFKSHINLMLECQLQSKSIDRKAMEAVFRIFGRVNSLISVAHYYYGQVQSNDSSLGLDQQRTIDQRFATHSKIHWKGEWYHYVQHAMVGSTADDSNATYAIAYFTNAVIDTLHSIYLENIE